MLQIKNLTKSFGDRTLYKNVNLEINKNDKIGLVGLNGSGKSTFLNILSGKDLADEGEICWQDKSITPIEEIPNTFPKLA